MAIVINALILVLNTCFGIYMFRDLTACNEAACEETHDGKRFVLKDPYVVHGIILIVVPASVFIFLAIVFVKLVLVVFADKKRKSYYMRENPQYSDKPYGEFTDEPEDAEAAEQVISVYFKIMDQVTYDPRQPFMEL